MDSYCGIYCGACLCKIVQEYQNIDEVAALTGRTIAQLTCSDCKTAQMADDCCFVKCCIDKGFNNCSECPEMPCRDLNSFANDGFNHHAATITNLYRIREIGLDKWLVEQKAKYTCPECGARTGWSFSTCLKCKHIL